MKKLIFTSLFVAGSLFGASLADIKDPSNPSEVAGYVFELKKDASRDFNDYSDRFEAIKTLIKNETMGMSESEKREYMDALRSGIEDRVKGLSTEEKAIFDMRVDRKFSSKSCGKRAHHHKHHGKMMGKGGMKECGMKGEKMGKTGIKECSMGKAGMRECQMGGNFMENRENFGNCPKAKSGGFCSNQNSTSQNAEQNNQKL